MVNPPIQNAHGTVTGRFLLAYTDGYDNDSDLDWVPAQGTLLFTPSPNYIVNTSLDLTFLPATFEAGLDGNGYLVGLDGNVGVDLLATDIEENNPVDWTWRVDFRLTDESGIPTRPITPYSFNLPAGETLDLSAVMPLESSNGVFYLKGDKGDIGETGEKGDTGERGPQGAPGASGGDSAYIVASQNGFVGTEEQWLSSLVGPRGIQGVQGLKGDKGDKGDRGIGYRAAYIDSNTGRLILSTDEYQNVDVGVVVGPRGQKGDTGETGPMTTIGGISVFNSDEPYGEITSFYTVDNEYVENFLRIGVQRGEQGIQGGPGPQGPQGFYATSFTVSGDVLKYDFYNPETQQIISKDIVAGNVRGPQGIPGPRIVSASLNEYNQLVFTDENGGTFDSGSSVKGPSGTDGKSAYQIAVDQGLHWYREYNTLGEFVDPNSERRYNKRYVENEADFIRFVVKGQDGVGVPVGGTIDQVLAKKSGANYDYNWVTVVTSSTVGSAVINVLNEERQSGNISTPGVGSTPYKMRVGQEVIQGSGPGEKVVNDVRFSSNNLSDPFTNPPIVTLTTDVKNILATVSNVTNSKMTITIKTIDNATIPQGTMVTVNWTAVQMTEQSSDNY
jgi:hypothetical protein